MTAVNSILQQPVCKRCFEGGHEVKDCKEEKENFDLIGPIAAFIGARLQYPCPEVNGQGNPWVSTILVEQHKEKFWYVRVYCKIAFPGLVQRKWEFLKDRHRRLEAGEKFYWHPSKSIIEMLGSHGDEAPEEFFARCTLHDAIHYRKVHMDAVRLRPHLRERICDQADHTTLLHEKFEDIVVDPKQLEYQCQKYHVQNWAELHQFFQKVYNPSFKDQMELRD